MDRDEHGGRERAPTLGSCGRAPERQLYLLRDLGILRPVLQMKDPAAGPDRLETGRLSAGHVSTCGAENYQDAKHGGLHARPPARATERAHRSVRNENRAAA